jgi:hypothetical protein
MKRLVLTALGLAALTACASPATYAPQTSPRGQGFSEQRIENDRVRVTFRGAGSDNLINDYALLRAADLTLHEGYDWFHVVGRSQESAGYSSGPHMSVGVGGTNYGGHRGHGSAVGVGIGTGFDLGPGPMRTVTLEVKFGKGPRPDDRDAYDARSVSQSIRAHMGPPR